MFVTAKSDCTEEEALRVTGSVLVVDDTPTNLEVISEALDNEGFDVTTAISGDRALRQLEHRLPDLILLDVMMPGIDGFETCRRIKQNLNTHHIPIIFLTALSDVESKVQALDLGAVDYITKPFYEKELIRRVKTHLKLHSLTQNLEDQIAQQKAEIQASQLRLIQHEKMSALGNLVAGVAHEINNPVGAIVGNVNAIRDYIQDLFDLIDLYHQQLPQPGAEITEKLEEIDLDYLREDLPKLVEAMQNGGARIRTISQSLRMFSRSDNNQKSEFNIHEGIDSTLLILRHRLKANENRPEIIVTKEYGNIPKIECFPGQLNQVFMNIFANAIDALDASNKGRNFEEIKERPNCITIQTTQQDEQIRIAITDNAKGMTDEIKNRIFDHLFTTKEVGKGTGLGLAIARQIVEQKHGGRLEVQSKLGQGTQFSIVLPEKALG